MSSVLDWGAPVELQSISKFIVFNLLNETKSSMSRELESIVVGWQNSYPLPRLKSWDCLESCIVFLIVIKNDILRFYWQLQCLTNTVRAWFFWHRQPTRDEIMEWDRDVFFDWASNVSAVKIFTVNAVLFNTFTGLIVCQSLEIREMENHRIISMSIWVVINRFVFVSVL